jgi:transcription initiation factor IIE alpha subunit
MRRALVGCNRCGYATGRHTAAAKTGRCPRCGAPLLEMELGELCAVVRQQRDAERSRTRSRVRL